MPRTETQRLVTELDTKDNFTPAIGKADRSLTGFERHTSSAFSNVKKGFGVGIGLSVFNAGLTIATRTVSTFSGFVNSGIQSLNELQQVQAGTAAVIKSTGGAAKVSAQQVRDLSNSVEDLTTVDDKTVQAGANLLLTFTNIRNAAGKNNDIFNRAVLSTTNLAIAMNKGSVEGLDLKASAIQLGKALNDPIKGLTALGRVGVTFTAQQKQQIKDLVKHNDLLGAQKIILGEIDREFGGAGAAQAKTYAGQQRRLADAVEDAKIALVTGLLPGLTRVSKALADTFRSKEFVKGVSDLGVALGNVLTGENVTAFINFGKEVIPPIVEGLKLAGTASKTLFDIWKGIPKELQSVIVAGLVVNKVSGGLVTRGIGAGIGGLLGGIADIFKGGLFGGRGTSPANPVFVTSTGVPGGPGGVLGGGGGLSLAGVVTSVVGGLLAGHVIGHALVDPGLNDQQRQIAADMRKQLASGDAVAISTGLRAIRTGIKNIEAIPGAALEFAGQLDFLKKAEADYVAALKKTTLDVDKITHPIRHARADTIEAQSHRTRDRNLTKSDVESAVKVAVVAGNRNLPSRHDINDSKVTIAASIRQARADITRVESAGLHEIRSGVSVLQAVLAGVLSGGFSGVIAAVGGIRLPSTIESGPKVAGRGPGKGGSSAPVDTTDNQNRGRPRLESIRVTTSISTADVTRAGTVRNRYGGTPAQVGAQ